MPGVGGPYPARLLVTIERQRVEPELGAPEAGAEAFPQRVRLLTQRPRHVVMSQRLSESRSGELRGIGIRLHLTEGDRPFRNAPVGVKHRITRVLPALLQQAVRCAPLIFDEPVAVTIPVALDPRQRRADVRPDRLDEREV